MAEMVVFVVVLMAVVLVLVLVTVLVMVTVAVVVMKIMIHLKTAIQHMQDTSTTVIDSVRDTDTAIPLPSSHDRDSGLTTSRPREAGGGGRADFVTSGFALPVLDGQENTPDHDRESRLQEVGHVLHESEKRRKFSAGGQREVSPASQGGERSRKGAADGPCSEENDEGTIFQVNSGVTHADDGTAPGPSKGNHDMYSTSASAGTLPQADSTREDSSTPHLRALNGTDESKTEDQPLKAQLSRETRLGIEEIVTSSFADIGTAALENMDDVGTTERADDSQHDRKGSSLKQPGDNPANGTAVGGADNKKATGCSKFRCRRGGPVGDEHPDAAKSETSRCEAEDPVIDATITASGCACATGDSDDSHKHPEVNLKSSNSSANEKKTAHIEAFVTAHSRETEGDIIQYFMRHSRGEEQKKPGSSAFNNATAGGEVVGVYSGGVACTDADDAATEKHHGRKAENDPLPAHGRANEECVDSEDVLSIVESVKTSGLGDPLQIISDRGEGGEEVAYSLAASDEAWCGNAGNDPTQKAEVGVKFGGTNLGTTNTQATEGVAQSAANEDLVCRNLEAVVEGCDGIVGTTTADTTSTASMEIWSFPPTFEASVVLFTQNAEQQQVECSVECGIFIENDAKSIQALGIIDTITRLENTSPEKPTDAAFGGSTWRSSYCNYKFAGKDVLPPRKINLDDDDAQDRLESLLRQKYNLAMEDVLQLFSPETDLASDDAVILSFTESVRQLLSRVSPSRNNLCGQNETNESDGIQIAVERALRGPLEWTEMLVYVRSCRVVEIKMTLGNTGEFVVGERTLC